MELEGKVAVVTGGARRVGKAIALALAENGLRVCVHYGGSAEAAEATVREIRELGTEAVALQADLADEQAARGVVAAAVEAFGRVDVLVNSAAIFQPGSLQDTTSEQWERHFQINLKAPFLLSQAFAAQLAPTQAGKIISVTDWRALRPGADHFAYTITKSALIAMTNSMAVSLAPNVQVNCVALGAILLPAGADTDYQQQLLADIPAGRMGGTHDVGRTVAFLVRDGDFITGETILLDGGRHLV